MKKWILILFISNGLFSQTNPITLTVKDKVKIVQSIENASKHAIKSALNKNGVAKGDYDLVSGKWEAYETMWHTGQLINGLLDAYSVTNSKLNLKTAVLAGNWWIAQQYPQNHKLAGYLKAIHGAEVGNYINTTTITDGTPGLFKLSKITKNPKYAQVATDAGDFILQHLYIENEKLSYNIVDPETGEVWEDKSPHKQHQNHLITIKEVARPNAEGFLFKEMYDFTKNETYKTAFINICNGLIETQSDNGFWMDYEPNDKNTGKIHARFNTWNAEALVECYKLTNDQKYLVAATKTAEALAKIQQKNGFIYYTTYTSNTFEIQSPCGSAVSFAGLLWLSLYELGNKSFGENIKKAYEVTINNQHPINHPDKNLAGGYFEIRQKTNKTGQTEIIYRDIATAFGLRFMSKLYQLSF